VGLTLHVQDGQSFRLRLGQALSVAVDGDLIRTRPRSTSKATDKSVRPTQIKVKGSGQECPLHTIHGTQSGFLGNPNWAVCSYLA
jgi:hypothetical protein